eukprot:1570190-Alexandrium_andersonii.AAC.1
MSASLVGSEMCIRDRSKHAQRAKRPSRRQESAIVGESPRFSAKHRRRCACLLYTSDAADDM